MKKHILVMGPSRAGKSTLARRISKELGYNLIKLDDLVSGFQYAFPELGIVHDSNNEKEIAKKFTKFLNGILMECQEGVNIHNDVYFVVEGVFIDLDVLFEDFKRDDFYIIGLSYDKEKQELFDEIRANDTDDEWTYYNSDEELWGNCDYFLDTNRYCKEIYEKYKILNYDTSNNREEVFERIISDIKDEQKLT